MLTESPLERKLPVSLRHACRQAGDCAGSWIAVTVAWPPLCVIWADTWSPTLTPPMLETLPVTRVALVTAAVTVCPARRS